MQLKKTVAFSKNAANVFFHILTGCNLRCRHCYINPAQHGHRTLPLETIEKWMRPFVERCASANIIFLGGEPTLHPDLADAAESAKGMGYGSVTIDTNGYLFHDILNRATPDAVDFISFSLDGATRKTNDAIRGDGVFDTCLKNIPDAKTRGFGVSLIYTVSRMNLHELDRMPALLSDLGVDRFFIQVIGIRGESAKAEETLQVDKRTWEDLVPRVAAEAAETGMTVSYPKVYLGPEDTFECAGTCAENFFIFPNGRVYRCPLCEDFPLHAMAFEEDRLVHRPPITETELFQLNIPEGCVMNRLVQPDNLAYDAAGRPEYRIACCMLKEEMSTA